MHFSRSTSSSPHYCVELGRKGNRRSSRDGVLSKTIVRSPDGLEPVLGYHIAGEILGSDGIDAGVHACEAVALEDADVCALPFHKMEELARRHLLFQHNLHRQLSHEVGRLYTSILMRGLMRGEQRLIAFLLDLAVRYQTLGYSSSEFILTVSRREIAALLGLQLETVSRLFSNLHREGMIQTQGRAVKLLDRTALQRLMAGD